MGLTIYLQDDNGKIIDQVLDPDNLLHRQLTMANVGVLGHIDWYGDTLFNRLQMRHFTPAWNAFLLNATDSEESQIIHKVSSLAERSLEGIHLYVEFEGD